MTTVAQMIQWMRTLPQDAEVECGVEVTKGYSTYMEMRPVDIEACDALDFADEKYKEYPHVYGKIIINICGE